MISNQIHALILGINKALGWVQITTHGCNYTCPLKESGGKMLFRFKNAWHEVDRFVGPLTEIVTHESKGLISKRYIPR